MRSMRRVSLDNLSDSGYRTSQELSRAQPVTNDQELSPSHVQVERPCPRCSESIAADERASGLYCSSCGAQIADRPEHAWDDTGPKGLAGTEGLLPKTSRRQLQICFWTLFVLGPLSIPLVWFGSAWWSSQFSLAALDLIPVWVRVLVTFFFCHGGAAYCLGKLSAGEPFDPIGETVVYSCFLFIVYLCLGAIFLFFFAFATLVFH